MAEPITLTSTASAVAAPIIKKILDDFSEAIVKRIGRSARTGLDKAIVQLRIGFDEYIRVSYDKCCQFKTILNPHQPLRIPDNYLHVTLSCGSDTVQDYDLIKQAGKKKRLVVTGLAGSGKSMFMKYFTISKFEYHDGILPLFIELRHINQITDFSLLTFIRATCTASASKVTEEQFNLALKAGVLMLILDGLDEVNYEFRDSVQKQIFEIEKNFPEAVIVVLVGPMNDLVRGQASTSSFYVFKVNDLTKAQCISLINSLDYDRGVKKRFIHEVASELYDSHRSFLSSPPLTTIMLLTYEGFAEIPKKMHAFYSQAFDTLFQKHDAQKEQFQRKMYTGLPREEFKAHFASFSALSYLDQRFSFDSKSLLETARQAITYTQRKEQDKSQSASQPVTPEHLIADLRESVCMLQQDGLDIVFVHRSFQEYFTAVFATSIHGAKVKRILDQCALRFGDSVITMAHDMHPETVEQEWVLPAIQELENAFQLSQPSASLSERYSVAIPSIHLHRAGDKVLMLFQVNPKILGPLQALRRIYPERLKPVRLGHSALLRLEDARRAWLSDDCRHEPRFKMVQALLRETRPTSHVVPYKAGVQTDWWLRKAGFEELFPNLRRGFSAIRKEIAQREKRRANILDEFL